jgi:hypothetical protein
MTRKKFWAIIDSTLNAKDQEEQLKLIKTELMKLSVTEVLSFSNILNELLGKSHNIRLGIAAAFINQGCSPEEFRFFKLWLISKGQIVYEHALKDPDSLADAITQSDIDKGAYFEEFGYIVSDISEERIADNIWEGNEPNLESVAQWDHYEIDEKLITLPNLVRRLSDHFHRLLVDAHKEGKKSLTFDVII